MNEYDRIARVIGYLDEHFVEQPSLEELAGVAGLSAFHFHRLFVEWAGVTPKSFLRCLTMRHARGLLVAGESVMGVAMEAGLSGPGRLHDLCVTLEAASPGEIKTGGVGMAITFGFGVSPFGDCFVGVTERGVCHLVFVEAGQRDAAVESLAEAWPNPKMIRDDTVADETLNRIFATKKTGEARPPLHAFVKGTAFQLRVWRALLKVSPHQSGQSLTTYGRLAKTIGQPNAARAVGNAVGANPIAYLIPCHRVIQGTGAIGGYRWGPNRKRAIIAWETVAGREVE